MLPLSCWEKKWKTFSNQNKAGGGAPIVLYSPNSDRKPFIIIRRRKNKTASLNSHDSFVYPIPRLTKKFIKLKKNNPKKSYSMSASRQTPKKNNNDKSENFSLYLSIPQLIS